MSHPSLPALLSLALRNTAFIDRIEQDRVRLTGIANTVFAAIQQAQTKDSEIDLQLLRGRLQGNEAALALIAEAAALDVPETNYTAHRDELRAQQLGWAIDGLANRYGGLNAADQDPRETLKALQGEVMELVEKFVIGQQSTIYDGKGMVRKMLAEMSEREASGIPTGLKSLDTLLLGGPRLGNFVVIAANTGGGKSALMCNVADNLVHAGVPTLISSIEMTIGELMPRMIASRTYIPLQWINSAKALKQLPLDLQQTHLREVKAYESLPIFCDEAAEVSLPYLRAVVRRHVRTYGVRVIFVDYLQLMETEERDTRARELDELCRGLKILAKEERVIIYALAQLGREPMKTGRRPKLSDLRESGGIEQNANIVGLLSEEATDDDAAAKPEEAHVILDVAKHRGGPTGALEFLFEKRIMAFKERR